MTKKKETLYLLGGKMRSDDHYGLTTWYSEDNAPIFYGVYDHMAKMWDKSELPIAIYDTEDEALQDKTDWCYIGFGWK